MIFFRSSCLLKARILFVESGTVVCWLLLGRDSDRPRQFMYTKKHHKRRWPLHASQKKRSPRDVRMATDELRHALAAGGGSIVVSLLTTPLEVLKVRQQAGGSPPKSIFSISVRLVGQEGVFALWTGLRATLIMQVPAQAIYMTLYEHIYQRIRAPELLGQQQWVAALVAGGSARMVASSIVSPVELLRTQIQAAAPGANVGSTLTATARSTVEREGVRGLWKGLVPTLWRDVPFSCIYWIAYEKLKRSFAASDGVLSVPYAFAAGASAGSLAALLTTPLDVIKTRQQVSIGSPAGTRHGTGSLLLGVLREGGVSALFAGLGPRLLKVAPSCAVMITSYELGKRLALPSLGDVEKKLGGDVLLTAMRPTATRSMEMRSTGLDGGGARPRDHGAAAICTEAQGAVRLVLDGEWRDSIANVVGERGGPQRRPCWCEASSMSACCR